MSAMEKADLEPVASLYSKSLQEHGTESKGVGWNDTQSHKLRFEKLAQVIDDKTKPVTIADLGCGYVALFGYLCEKPVPLEIHK